MATCPGSTERYGPTRNTGEKNILWEENPTKLPFTNLQIYNLQESPGKWKEKRVNWEGRPAKWKDYSVEWEVRSATKFIKNVS